MNEIIHGDCLEMLREFPDNHFDSVVTDPPYGLEFMGKEWDSFKPGGKRPGFGKADKSFRYRNNLGVPSFGVSGNPTCQNCGGDKYRNGDRKCSCDSPSFPNQMAWQMRAYQEWCEQWAAECLRVLKPGGYLLAFGGTRTYHRLASGIEDAGFEIRDSLHWVYAAGFPKSHNLDKTGKFCGCDPVSKYAMRTVRNTDVSPSVSASTREGALLFPSLPEQSSSRNRAMPSQGTQGSQQSRMEGWSNPQEGERELQRSATRPLPTGASADGSQGRVYSGTPPCDGAMDQAYSPAGRGRESQGSQPVEQRTREPGTLSDEQGSQTGGVWEICGRCGKPAIPRGLGTGLKPAHEPIMVARKPLVNTVAQNVLQYGTGALNIDACRVKGIPPSVPQPSFNSLTGQIYGMKTGDGRNGEMSQSSMGRWAPNILLTHSPECVPAGVREVRNRSGSISPDVPSEPVNDVYRARGRVSWRAHGDGGVEAVQAWDCAGDCPVAELDRQSGGSVSRAGKPRKSAVPGEGYGMTHTGAEYSDAGGASRFYPCFKYQAKAGKKERPSVDGVQSHPTVKPLELIRWLVRLVTPPGGIVLDPFAGTGTTGEACRLEGFKYVLIEREDGYVRLIRERMSGPASLFDDWNV